MKRKITRSVLLLFFVCVGLAACKGTPSPENFGDVSASQVDITTLTLSYEKAAPGDTITAVVNCAVKPDQKLSGVQFDLVFDPNVLEPVVKEEQTDYYNEKLASYGVCLANIREDSIRFIAADISFKNPIVDTSDIVTVTFKVTGELSDDSLSLSGVEFTDMEGSIVDNQIKTNIH